MVLYDVQPAERTAIGILQITLCPLHRLDRGLFVDTNHDGVLRRRQIEPAESHDYKRHGTSTLFAALEVATGKVITCKILDLRFQAVPDEITPCHSSLGGEFGEGIDVVKDAQHRLRRREQSSRP